MNTPLTLLPEVASLAEILDRRGVSRVAYFHTDHFEPWSLAPARPSFEACAEAVQDFADKSAKSDFGRRQTLFYKPKVDGGMGRAASIRVTSDDPFGFVPRTDEIRALAKSALQCLLGEQAHEIQVHVHHEHYTWNTSHTRPAILSAFERPGVKERDSSRFELGLSLTLDAIREETGLPLDEWFFVHGVWALNASDPAVCQIEDEIRILMRNGCRGDFSFPAGRQHVDPACIEPFFIKPFIGRRVYDREEAMPQAAWGNAHAASDRFFIWSSEITHRSSSLDYYSRTMSARLQDPVGMARDIVSRSVVTDGTLWFKTHAHSLHSEYFHGKERRPIPHDHPDVRTLFGLITDATAASGAALKFLTASEVYREFVTPSSQAPQDISLPVLPFDAMEDPVLTEQIQMLNRESRAFLTDPALPQSGAGDIAYASRRLAQGELLTNTERQIALTLRRLAARPQPVYEFGSGISLLSPLLAMNGYKTICIDPNGTRLSIYEHFLARIFRTNAQRRKNCGIKQTTAQRFLAEEAALGGVAIFTTLDGSLTDRELAAMLHELRRFTHVFLDVSRFFRPRDDMEQAALLEAMSQAGLGRAERVSGQRDSGLRLFRPPHGHRLVSGRLPLAALSASRYSYRRPV